MALSPAATLDRDHEENAAPWRSAPFLCRPPSSPVRRESRATPSPRSTAPRSRRTTSSTGSTSPPSPAASRRAAVPEAARLHGLRRAGAQDHAQAGRGPAEADRRQLKKQCKQEYDAAARPGARAAHLLRVDRARGRRARASRSPTPRSRSPSTSRRSSRSRRTPTTRSSSRTRARPRRTSSSASASTLLSNKIREKVTKGKDKVTDAQIEDYYDKNKQRFAQPERRDLRIVLTKTKAKAEQAKAGARGRRVVQVGRQEVLDRRRLQGAGRQAAGRRQGPAGEGVRRRDLQAPRRASSPARSRPSSATTSSRSTRSPRRPSRR